MNTLKNIYYINQIGQRPQLEDSIYPSPGKASSSDALFMVCDGVGGESMGEEASRIACEEFPVFLTDYVSKHKPLSQSIIDAAQNYVLEKMKDFAQKHAEAANMSTTLTLAQLNRDGIFTAWCGDSRIYHIRNGKVIWRTRDHSLVENLVKHGEISEEEANKHPQRNIITRSLSAGGSPSEIETYQITDLQPGDYILMCTDGVLEQITEERLKAIVLSENAEKMELFMAYCAGLTKDNFSLYLLELEGSGSQNLKPESKKFLFTAILAFAVLLIGICLMWEPISRMMGQHSPKPVKEHTILHSLPADEDRRNPDVRQTHPTLNDKPPVQTANPGSDSPLPSESQPPSGSKNPKAQEVRKKHLPKSDSVRKRIQDEKNEGLQGKPVRSDSTKKDTA